MSVKLNIKLESVEGWRKMITLQLQRPPLNRDATIHDHLFSHDQNSIQQLNHIHDNSENPFLEKSHEM